jgi:uncharacterized membrane protein (DUF4010 family)
MPVLQRLALALLLGLLVGVERERAGKETGVRTFGLAGLLGAAGGLASEALALAALALVGIVILGNIAGHIARGEELELTTAVALAVVTLGGVLSGLGYIFAATALGVGTAALLAWKQPLRGFALGLSESEVRAALIFGIIAFVVYPVLPDGYVDRWRLLNPRQAWLTVVLVSALGFVNYVLLRIYGVRGLVYGLFLGSLVNSSVAIAELAARLRKPDAGLRGIVAPGVALANAAMLIRNIVLLALLAAPAALAAAPAFGLMLLASLAVAIALRPRRDPAALGTGLRQESPFSLQAALRFGALFLAIAVAGDLGQRALGTAGFFVVSAVGGIVSSASATATAATLAAQGKLTAEAAAIGAMLAAALSALLNVPLLWPAAGSADHGKAGEPGGARRALVLTTLLVIGAGLAGVALAWLLGWPELVERGAGAV